MHLLNEDRRPDTLRSYKRIRRILPDSSDYDPDSDSDTDPENICVNLKDIFGYGYAAL